MTRLRVLAAVVLPPHLHVSGAARAAERLTLELAQLEDVDIDIANMAGEVGAPESDASFVGARRLAVRVRNPMSWARFLPNRVRTPLYLSDIPDRITRGSYDLVHIHNPTPALAMWQIARAARRAGIPYVVSTHGFVEIADGARVNNLGPLGRLAWSLLVARPVQAVVRGAARIFMLSPADAATVAQLGGRGVPKSVVTNGVDVLDDIVDDPEQPPPLPAFLDETSEHATAAPLRAFFLANHTPNKGVDVLLEAFTALEEPFTLVVGGDKRDFVDYERFIRRCGAHQRIIVPGRLSDAEVDALFAWADVFVFPTLADTLPLVVLEAMAHATPVVASAVGGIPYQLDRGCGVLVPPGDVAALAEALRKLCRDGAARDAMGRAGRLRVRSIFSWRAAALAAREAYGHTLTAAADNEGLQWSSVR